jgi:hypothetical protein
MGAPGRHAEMAALFRDLVVRAPPGARSLTELVRWKTRATIG